MSAKLHPSFLNSDSDAASIQRVGIPFGKPINTFLFWSRRPLKKKHGFLRQVSCVLNCPPEARLRQAPVWLREA
jgi:hypothetical protein